MPKKGGTITPQERAVIDAATSSRTQTEIAERAGYANPSGVTKALARPVVQAEIVARQIERLTKEVLPLAVQVHIDMLTDARTPAGARAQLIKLAYDKTFGEGAYDRSLAGKEPHEMSAEEISKALQALQHEASERARPIIEGESAQVAPNILD